MVKKLPTWFQLSSKVFVSSLLMVIGLITVNPFTVSADTVYTPTTITGDSRLDHFRTTDGKLYQSNEGLSTSADTECYYYFTFSEPFVLTKFEGGIVINQGRVPQVKIYGSNSNFSTNIQIGSGSLSSSGVLTINMSSNTTAYQYYVIGMTANYKNTGGNYFTWSMGTILSGYSRSYRFTGTSSVTPTTYTISATVSPNGAGTVLGAGQYSSGDSASLVATANSGYTFTKWTNSNGTLLTTSNTLNITVTQDASYIAVFDAYTPTPTPTYNITTSVYPSGAGTVTGGGTYDSGTVISLTATPNSGYSFSQWSDGNTSNPRSVTVSANATYTAQFISNAPTPSTYTVYITANNDSYGSVSPSSITGQAGSSNSIYAFPNTGYIFDHWIEVGSGNNVSSNNPYTFTLSANVTYQAVFVVDPNYVPTSVLLLVHKNIYNYNYPTEAVTLTTFSYPDAHTVNNYGQEVIKTLVAGQDYPAYVDYAVTYNYSTTLYSYKGIKSSTGTHYGNGITVESGVNKDTIRVNAQAFYSSAYTGSGSSGQQYYVVTVYYPLPDVSSITTINRAYESVSYTSGNITYLPDNVGSSTDQILSFGDEDSAASSTDLNNSTSDLQDNFDDYFTMENGFLNDMNDSLQDIEVSSDLVSNNGFLAAAQWVRNQFDTITTNTPFGSIVTFTLILGLALLIIGKIRS